MASSTWVNPSLPAAAANAHPPSGDAILAITTGNIQIGRDAAYLRVKVAVSTSGIITLADLSGRLFLSNDKPRIY